MTSTKSAKTKTVKISDSSSNNSIDQQSSSANDSLAIDKFETQSNPNIISISDTIISIDINCIEPDPEQPRKIFDSETLTNLQNSIQKTNLQNPIFVRKNDHKPDHYLIVDGERRWRACKNLNLTEIKCRIVTSDVEGCKIVVLTQNLHREDLLPIERANAFSSLLTRLQGSDENAKQQELINIVNLSKSYISEILTISKLDDKIKEEALTSKKWSANKLLQLAKIKNTDKRLAKFEEFKAIINKPHKSSVNESDNTDSNSDSNSSQSDKKISVFKNHSVLFKNRLDKLYKIRLDDSEREEIKAELSEIQELINKILS
jgi:ParB family chromosome partitioning protein